MLASMRLLPAVATLLLVGACTPWVAPLPPGSRVEIQGRPALQTGLAALRRLSAWTQPAAYVAVPTSTDVAWLKVYLRRLDTAGNETLVGQLPGLPPLLHLTQLQHNATYRLRLQALDADLQTLEDNAPNPDPMVNEGACETLFQTGTETIVLDLTFPLKLRDENFSGTAQGAVTAGVDGALVVSSPALIDAIATPTADGVADPVLVNIEGVLYPVSELAGAQYEFPYDVPNYECYGGGTFDLGTSLGNRNAILAGNPVSLPAYRMDASGEPNYGPPLYRCGQGGSY